jgi:Holliday junction resolvase RusA-like endonuclease
MMYKFTIPTVRKKLPSLNDYIAAERVRIGARSGRFLTKGAVMKKEWQSYISLFIRRDLRGVKIEKPVLIHYRYFEENRKRDLGNIHAPCQKFVEDALQDCKVIANDNQKCVVGFTAHFEIDKENPRVEVVLEET